MQVRDGHPDRVGLKHRAGGIDDLAVLIEHRIARVLVRTRFCVTEIAERTLLGCGIRPILAHTVQGRSGRSGYRRIVLGQVPLLNDPAELLHIVKARRIATILDDLHGFLVVRAVCQSFVPLLAAVHSPQQVSGMVVDRVLNGTVLSEVCRNAHIAAVRVLLPGFHRIHGMPIPGRTRPGVPGKRCLHAKTVIGILCQFGLAVAGFQNELRHGHAGKDAGLPLVSREQRGHLCHNRCRLHVLQRGCLQASGHSRSAQCRRYLGRQITEAAVQPVAGAGFVRIPAVDGQNHLIRCRRIVQRLVLVPQPEQLGLAVPLADVGTKLDQRSVHGTVHSVRVGQVAGALDGDSPLVVCRTGRAPAPVLLLDTKRHTTVLADAVVTACLPGGTGEAATDTFRRQLPHHTVRRDAVDAVCPQAGMVRAEVRISH